MISEKNSVRNARIESTRLGFEHSVFSYHLQFDYEDGGVQGFGGYVLDNPSPDGGEREGTKYGMDTIIGIMRAVGVDEWEKLRGKYVRVKFGDESMGFGYNIVAIGHITKEIWFDPKELAKRLK